MSLKTACEAIVKGYAEGKCAMDNGMIDHVLEMADHAEAILYLISMHEELHRPRTTVTSSDDGPREPTTQDLIDYLQQYPNLVVVRSDDDVQSPGDYVALDAFFAQWGG